MSPLERAFVSELVDAMDRGEEPPSARGLFLKLVARDLSRRSPMSISRYGPGAKFTNLRKQAIAEYDDFNRRKLEEGIT